MTTPATPKSSNTQPRADSTAVVPNSSLTRRQLLVAGAAMSLVGTVSCSEPGSTDAPSGTQAPETDSPIKGTVAPGFELVRERFLEKSALLGDGGAAFAAYRRGELVVDLWAGKRHLGGGPDSDWQRDTRVHIQSTSKAVTAWPAMLLVEQGELDLDQRVAHYWPEYGTNGKEETTVRQLLSHAAGSVILPGYTELLDLEGNGFDQYEEIASRLAAAEPSWKPGTAHGYHGYTYGNLVSEVIYRITGKRAGEFIRDELAQPLELNLWLGTPTSEQATLAEIRAWPAVPMPELPAEIVDQMPSTEDIAEQMKNSPLLQPGTWQFDAGFRGLLGGPMDEFSKNIQILWSQPKALAAEFGAANATSDAKSLARLYVPFTTAGEIGAAVAGSTQLSESTLLAFSQPAEPGGIDQLLGMDMGWRCGSHHGNRAFVPTIPPVFGPGENVFGMTGGGGNYGFADPEAGISGGFVRNHYTNSMALSAFLVESLYEALEQQA